MTMTPSTASVALAASSSMLALDVTQWSSREWTNGLQIDTLHDLDTLSVQTRNSTYDITVVKPSTGEVLVRGGHLFPNYTPMILSGSSLGGTFLKRHGIYIGFRMELHHARQTIVTSPTCRPSHQPRNREPSRRSWANQASPASAAWC